jgi:hypothetical protein
MADYTQARDDMLNAFNSVQLPMQDSKAYYDSLKRPEAIGIATPVEMRKLLAHVGYPRLYVDAIAERQELEGFSLGRADEADAELWDWWQANDLDAESTLGHTDALIYGRSYITVSAPDPDIDPGIDPSVPIIRVEPPTSLYADIDPRTRLVTKAIRAVYGEDQVYGNRTTLVAATLYLPNETVYWVANRQGTLAKGKTVKHNLGVVPVIPMANRTRLSDRYGTSEISPELRSVTDAAARILMNMQATAELMAIPQRLIFGVRPEDLGVDPETGKQLYDAYMSRILAFEDSEVKATQFTAAELRNFVDALDALDRKAAAYTGLPPQYLSFSSDNPASAEAIKSSESRLVKKVERKNLLFGGAWEQAMRVAWLCVKKEEPPQEMYRLESIWRDPSTPTYAAKAAAAAQLYANGAGVIPRERARQDMGYTITEREEMRQWDQAENPLGQLAGLYSPVPPTPPAPPGPPAPEQPMP